MASVVVVERRPRWAPELRRQFSADEIPVRAARSFDDGLARTTFDGLLVVDLAVDLEACLEHLGRQRGCANAIHVIALVDDRTAELEWTLRELGAKAVLPNTTTGERLASVCRRRLAK